MRRHLASDGARAVALVLAVTFVLAGCGRGGASKADLEEAKRFDSFPLYWVGGRFEKWPLRGIQGLEGRSEFVSFIYGECTPKGGEQPSCTPPLELQVFPLCAHLDAVTRAPIWQRRHIRGAPVGTIDGAPVLLSRGAQVKAYRGEGSDAGLPLRALRALRSLNRVRPIIGSSGEIPAPATGILEGARPCST
jgi:hypothetical protein